MNFVLLFVELETICFHLKKKKKKKKNQKIEKKKKRKEKKKLFGLQ
jgi:hypothetical protein